MEFNIYNEIINILNEYDLLLEKVRNQRGNNQTQKEEKELKEMNNFLNSDFLKYIFENINIEKKDDDPMISNKQKQNYSENDQEELNNNQKLNNDQEDLNNDQEDLNNDREDLNNDREDLNNDREDKKDEVNEFIKKYYRKIILLTHPDKTNDIIRNEMFKKAKEYSENKFLIGIIKLCFDLKIEMESLNKILIKQIFFDIRVIQQKIIELKKILNNY